MATSPRKPGSGRPKGARSSSRKLTPERQAEARQLRAKGLSVAEIARTLGVSHQALYAAVPGLSKPRRAWTRAEDKLLGTMPDKMLARRLGRDLAPVRQRRHRRGIPVFVDPQRRLWSAAEDAIVKGSTIAVAVQQTGRSRSAVLARRMVLRVAPRRLWTAEDDARLGTALDAEVAQQLGRSKASVLFRRWSLGIPAYRGGA